MVKRFDVRGIIFLSIIVGIPLGICAYISSSCCLCSLFILVVGGILAAFILELRTLYTDIGYSDVLIIGFLTGICAACVDTAILAILPTITEESLAHEIEHLTLTDYSREEIYFIRGIIETLGVTGMRAIGLGLNFILKIAIYPLMTTVGALIHKALSAK